ncbi:UNVERIFIED_CONTAM: hypothetical protein Sindi_1922400 [Sesamum indicum]
MPDFSCPGCFRPVGSQGASWSFVWRVKLPHKDEDDKHVCDLARQARALADLPWISQQGGNDFPINLWAFSFNLPTLLQRTQILISVSAATIHRWHKQFVLQNYVLLPDPIKGKK